MAKNTTAVSRNLDGVLGREVQVGGGVACLSGWLDQDENEIDYPAAFPSFLPSDA